MVYHAGNRLQDGIAVASLWVTLALVMAALGFIVDDGTPPVRWFLANPSPSTQVPSLKAAQHVPVLQQLRRATPTAPAQPHPWPSSIASEPSQSEQQTPVGTPLSHTFWGTGPLCILGAGALVLGARIVALFRRRSVQKASQLLPPDMAMAASAGLSGPPAPAAQRVILSQSLFH